MIHRNYKFEWGLLVVTVLFSVASSIADCYSESLNWFARSGAIVVLASVIVEYRISSHIYEDIQRAQFLQSKIDVSVPLKGKPAPQRERVAIAAHILVVLGTIIWGYGDLAWS